MSLPLVCLIAIIVGVVSDVTTAALCATALALVSVTVVCPRAWRLAVMGAAAACLCGAHGAATRRSALESPLVAALGPLLDARSGPPVFVSGVLRDDAAVDADGARLSLDVDRVRADASTPWREIRGRAQVSVGGALARTTAREWVRGRRVALPIQAKRPPIWRNPGSASEGWQRLRRGVDITGGAKSAALVVVERGRPLSEWGARLRAYVRDATARTVAPTSRESADIVTAILIGDRTGLDDDTVRKLQMSGTYHVIAISGGNIAILVVTCLVVLRVFIRSPRVTAALTLGVVVLYGGLVGDQASVNRAVTAAAVVLFLQVIGWCAPTLRIFWVAALVVALIDPLTVIDVSAWLSFGATLGIVVISPQLMRLAPKGMPRVVTILWGMCAATLAAELALMPVSAAVFSRVSLAGLLLNFIAIPAMTVTQLAGTVLVMVADVFPILAHAAATLAHLGAVALVRSTALLELMPWLSWQTPPVGMWWTMSYYVGLGLAVWAAASRRWQRAGIAIAAAALLVIVTSPPWPWRRPAPGLLRVSMLDVGQGQAIAVQFPTGQTLLLDAGGTGPTFDIGARVVEPALWALGIHRLDWLAVTHGDLDHAGGAPTVMRDLRPREVWEGVPVPRDLRMQALRAKAQAQGVVWRRLATGHTLEVGGAVVEVLNPPLPDWERRDNRNDDSLVVRVQLGQVSLLLTGDAERQAEDDVAVNHSARLRVLSAPHHGSRTSSTPGLLRRFLPHAVFVSAGRANTFGHPAPDVLARYEQLGVEVFRTDLDGAIILETDGRDVVVRTAGGRFWRLTYAENSTGGQ